MNARSALLALLAAATLAAAPAPLHAQDKGGKGGKGGGQKEPRKAEETPEWRASLAIGRLFAAADAAGLSRRMPAGEKVRIALDVSGEYKAEQAQVILSDWFRGKSDISAKIDKLNGLTASFDVAWRQDRSETQRTGRLFATLRQERDGSFVLVRLEL
jgi:hypothetical protein